MRLERRQLGEGQRKGEVLNCEVLTLEGAVLVIEPAGLLEDFCVAGVASDDTFVGVLCAYMLMIE
jgi:hypothetical protein